MNIQQLREMTKREYGLWFATAKSSDLKEVLESENLGGGISKFNKNMLIEVVMDLVEGIVSELTKQLKPKKERKQVAEEIKIYRELMKEKYKVNDYIFEDYSKADMYAQAGYFQDVQTKAEAKERYKKLIKYFHPDKATGNEEKFRNIQEAWEMAQSYLNYIEKVQGVDITSKEFCKTVFSK